MIQKSIFGRKPQYGGCFNDTDYFMLKASFQTHRVLRCSVVDNRSILWKLVLSVISTGRSALPPRMKMMMMVVVVVAMTQISSKNFVPKKKKNSISSRLSCLINILHSLSLPEVLSCEYASIFLVDVCCCTGSWFGSSTFVCCCILKCLPKTFAVSNEESVECC